MRVFLPINIGVPKPSPADAALTESLPSNSAIIHSLNARFLCFIDDRYNAALSTHISKSKITMSTTLTPLQSLVQSGTKLWLDSIDPDLIAASREYGASGATSNPVIVSDLLGDPRFAEQIQQLISDGHTDEEIAWRMTDHLVHAAQQAFLPIWESTRGNDGYVSFEVDPLLEDEAAGLSHEQRVEQYVALGTKWAAGHKNRMIKVPATPAGLDALETLAAAGITLNVTLIFTDRQYQLARDAVWRGAQQRSDGLDGFKSVYSIFVSRVDVYTEQHAAGLSAAAQGQVGIVNAKRIWAANQAFWNECATPLEQEIVFASTGTKKPEDPPWKYVAAFAGSDIETNPPKTNELVAESGRVFTAQVAEFPPEDVLQEIDREINFEHLEEVLMREGVAKFANPQKALIEGIAARR